MLVTVQYMYNESLTPGGIITVHVQRGLNYVTCLILNNLERNLTLRTAYVVELSYVPNGCADISQLVVQIICTTNGCADNLHNTKGMDPDRSLGFAGKLSARAGKH